ncbi:MAG: hypothetical protein LZF61_06275 [Nitrosomonas sp.]|nr:MAG: hypothetical protein LZF61_06275 [Nitrosomonas sp.]
MDAAERKRKMIIGGSLIATLIAAVLVEDDEEAVVKPTETLQPAKTAQDRARKIEANPTQLDVNKLGQRKFNALAGEIFLPTNWEPKRSMTDPDAQPVKLAQPIAAPPPPPPSAPPLQFKYSGKAVEGNQTWVFLSQAGENFVTRIGEKINMQYRLDAVTDEIVTVTYLPLNVKQTLNINNKIAGAFR